MTAFETAAGRYVHARPERLTVLNPRCQRITVSTDLTADEARSIALALCPRIDVAEPLSDVDVLRRAAVLLNAGGRHGSSDGAQMEADRLEQEAAEPEPLSEVERRALAAWSAFLDEPRSEQHWRETDPAWRETWLRVARASDAARGADR